MPPVLAALPAIAGLAGAGATIAGLASGGGGSGSQPAGQTTTNTIQKSDPWSGQQPYLTTGFAQAANLLGQGGPNYYPGTTFAAPNNYQTSAYDMLAQLGANPTALQSGAQNYATNTLNGSGLYTNPGNLTDAAAAGGGLNVNTGGLFMPIASGQYQNTAGTPTLNNFASGAMLSADNPYFQSMANQIKAQVQPQTDAQFAATGRMDSGLASRAQESALADAIGGLAYQNYQTGLGQQLGAAQDLSQIGQANIGNILNASGALTGLGATNAGLQLQGAQGLSNNYNTAAQQQTALASIAPSLDNMNATQINNLLTAGQGVQGQQQQAINDAMARWNFQQQQPYTNLQNYIAAIQGNYGGQTTGSQSTPYFQNNGAGALATGLAGISGLNGLAGLFSPNVQTGINPLLMQAINTTAPNVGGLSTAIPNLTIGGY